VLPELVSRAKEGCSVDALGLRHWRLSIPAGRAGRYRWAQLDDYQRLPRSRFPWQPPLRLRLRSRVSQRDIAGTWGFGFWNEPAALNIALRGTAGRLPALPEAAWFFHASPPNYLALRDDHPAQGFLAATFASLSIPSPLLASGALLLPGLLWPPSARQVRRLARLFVRDDAATIDLSVEDWHDYEVIWSASSAHFIVDGRTYFETAVAPRSRLGLVLWIDNQFAAFPPSGRLGTGTLATLEPAWLELADLDVEAADV